VLFTRALDAILALAVAIWKNLGHNADSARLKDGRPLQDYSVPYF
jgi:hypothetical protein